MAERVVIQVDAETAAAVQKLAAVGAASADMAGDAVSAATSSFGAFEQLELAIIAVDAAINLAARALGVLRDATARAVGSALDLREENDALVRQFERIRSRIDRVVASFGEIIIQGLEAAGTLERLETGLGNLERDILDADSALGQLVRVGFIGLVRGSVFVVQGLALISQGLAGLVDTARVTQEVVASLFQFAEIGVRGLAQAAVGQELNEALARLEQLQTREPGFVFSAEDIARQTERQVGRVRELANAYTELERASGAAGDRASASVGAVNNAVNRLAESQGNFAAFRDLLSTVVTELEAVAAAMQADARPPGPGREDGGGQTVLDAIEGLIKPAVKGPLSPAEQIGKIIKGEFPAAESKEPVAGLVDIFDSTRGAIASTLSGTLRDIGRFVTSAGAHFENLGNMMKQQIANAAASIGAAFVQAGVASLFTGNPLFAALGIGALFSTIAGLLSGSTAGAGRSAASVAPDVMLAARGPIETTSTVVVQQSIGAIFSRDESKQAVASLWAEAQELGELRRIRG
jgi:hypothetical protein